MASTLLELTVVILVMLFLGIIVLPAVMGRRIKRAPRINCVNNLKQIGVAARTWALDYSNAYPASLPIALGGAKESVEAGAAFRWFQVLSNELMTPWIVVCPSDTRARATNFGAGFSNTNVSYFVGLDAADTMPNMYLSGDRNLTNGTTPRNGILALSSNSVAGWTHQLHQFQGNVALADGSVQQFSNSGLKADVAASGCTNRLAMP
jgi:prepilin-type processing-associated H-X9-DG protein